MYLVAFVELKVTFNEDEHAPWLQALDYLSDCLSIVCYLKSTDNSGQTVVEKVRQRIDQKGVWRMGTRWRGLTPAPSCRMWIKSN